MESMKEIKSEHRYYYKSINKHSTRTYEWQGVKFYLDRTLDGCPPFFTVYLFEESRTLATHLSNEEGKEYWGDGWTWAQAEKEMEKIVILNTWRIKSNEKIR